MDSLKNVAEMAEKKKKRTVNAVSSDTSSSSSKRPFVWNGDTSLAGIKENQITHQLTLTQIFPASALNTFPTPAAVSVIKKSRKDMGRSRACRRDPYRRRGKT